MNTSLYKYWILSFVLSTLSLSWGYSQDIYQIKGATVVVELDFGDSTVQLQSKHLHIMLDNDNAKFKASLKLSTLINISDEKDLNPVFFTGEDILMTGKFKVDYIDTSNHAPLQFEFSGIITQDPLEIPVYGFAELQHVGGGGVISCMLGFGFTLNDSNNASLKNSFEKYHLKEIKVQVLQTILNRNN